MLADRRALAWRYDAALCDAAVRLPPRRQGCRPIFYRYVVRTAEVERLLAAFAARSVECKRPVFRPLHYYLPARTLPRTDSIYSQALSLPLYPGLGSSQARRVMRVARSLLQREPRRELRVRPSHAAS